MLAHPRPQHTDLSHDTQHHNAFIDCGHLSEILVNFLSHIFAPASYLQCTSLMPCWSPLPSDTCATQRKQKLIVVDDSALLENEEDGGPLCREATIASWKAGPAKKERRSLQWLASVMKRDLHKK
ncbi:hypothetical protein EJ02DRAFT_452301 [Clathrospora elynae]|uniref:Uncharacterized protein n=1 Tax=Clathrospora elynae TaxID=706981 RepID=A0A6A5SWS4_9PLEO|nr:hypothetical protein EJ02DRAFT_452301 [Clathrospora elynae]